MEKPFEEIYVFTKTGRDICKHKTGKDKGSYKGKPRNLIGIDSIYCRNCWHYERKGEIGKNGGTVSILCSYGKTNVTTKN